MKDYDFKLKVTGALLGIFVLTIIYNLIKLKYNWG
jgi:hypothetical protein